MHNLTNKASTLKLSVMMTYDFVLAQPLTTSKQFVSSTQFHLQGLSQPVVGFLGFPNSTAYLDHLSRLISSSHLPDKYTMMRFMAKL